MSKFKLSRSKREDSKQPKISNFFGLAKQECKSLASKEPRNNEIYSDTNLQLTSKEPSTQADRLPGDTICMKCFSKLNNDSCNNCNVSHSASKEINLPSGTIEDSAQITSCDKIEGKNDMSTDLITDLINEDVIPATPQLHKKRKRTDYVSAKSIKKIVNAENKKTEISKTKTKNVLVQKEDSHKALGEENPKLMCNEKENALSSRGMHNPFAKSSNKLPTFRQINEQHGIQNEECTVRITDSNKPHNTDTVGQTGSFVNGFHDNVFFNNKRLPQDNPVFSFEDINDSFLEDWNLSENSSHPHVNLDNGVRCEVVSTSVHADSGEMLLTLRPFSASVRATAICVLRGSWANTSVSAGDTVSVSAVPVPDQPGCWVVDDTVGLLTIHPDTLVSGTTVVGSLFCMRRSVLSDSYRGLDSDSSIMVIGSFLHELLQEVLKKKVFSIQDMKKVLDEFISSRHFIYSLYASGMPFEKTKETLSEFIPKIHAFVMKYIGSRKLNVGNTWNDKESWDGKVTDVADIEENIWAPKLGVKGKVDVTVHTVSRNKKKVMPLELKTGRASFSAEHRGQVILYTMMMSELGQSVDSGLLLYLREGIMREVSVGPVERRDLTLLRNQLVSWLRESQRVVMEGSRVVTPNLPPPISHHSACGKCPYLTLCSAALRVGDRNSMSEDNPLQGLSVASTDHLTLEHMEYVFHWSGLLRLEHAEALLRGTPVHNIWTVPPAQRKQKGSCLVNLTLVGQVTEVTAGSYEHVFELGGCGWEGAGPTEGDYYIVSCNERPAVAAGPVRHVLNNHITLHLERDLCAHYGKDRQWHLDKYESQTSLVFNMTNLGCLLDNTQQAGRLRSALVDLQLPTFQPKLRSRVMRESAGLINRLNSQQQQAVIRAIAADHFMLIKGMPGTGKTATMVALVELAVRLGQSVLITSHTHSAVDNVLLRLRGRVDLLRLGSTHKLHPQLAEYGEHTGRFTTPDEIQAFYNSKSVVGVTCLGAAHPLLVRRRFDMCLVDEATQVPQPTVLRPLMAANKFILVGDPEQLPPMVRSSQAKKLGLGQSLFARLDRPAVTTELSLQYRMNKRITQLANTLTYGGQLQCASPAVAEATLKLLHPLVGVPEWLSRALADSLAHSVVVLDTGTREESVNCENHYEGGIVSDIVAALNKAGVSAERTGVIAPYRAQVELLRKRVRAIDSQVEVNTVDQYQGRDKDVIIYSCTRSSIATERDILSDKNRLTVAITRSRYKLIIVGNVTLLRGYPLFDKLFRSLIDDCIIPIR